MNFTFIKRERGFTLLEILAAFLVFGLAFAVAMRGMSGSLRNTRVAGELTQAALYAQSKMELLGIEGKMEEGSDSGRFDDKFSWELTTELYDAGAVDSQVDPELVPIDLYKVTLTVYWDKTAGTNDVRFSTLYAVDKNFQGQAYAE